MNGTELYRSVLTGNKQVSQQLVDGRPSDRPSVDRAQTSAKIAEELSRVAPLATAALANLPDAIEVNRTADLVQAERRHYARQLEQEHVSAQPGLVTEWIAETWGSRPPSDRIVSDEAATNFAANYQMLRAFLNELPKDQQAIAEILSNFVVADALSLEGVLSGIRTLGGILENAADARMAGRGVSQKLDRLEGPALLLMAATHALFNREAHGPAPLTERDPMLPVIEALFGTPDLEKLPHLAGAIEFNRSVRDPWVADAETRIDSLFASIAATLEQRPQDHFQIAERLAGALTAAPEVLGGGDPQVTAKLRRHVDSLLENPPPAGGKLIDPPRKGEDAAEWIRSNFGPVWAPKDGNAAQVDAKPDKRAALSLLTDLLLRSTKTAASEDRAVVDRALELLRTKGDGNVDGLAYLDVQRIDKGIQMRFSGLYQGGNDHAAYPVAGFVILVDGTSIKVSLGEQLDFYRAHDLNREILRHPELVSALKNGIAEMIETYLRVDSSDFHQARQGFKTLDGPVTLEQPLSAAIDRLLENKLSGATLRGYRSAREIIDGERGAAMGQLKALAAQLIDQSSSFWTKDYNRKNHVAEMEQARSEAIAGLRKLGLAAGSEGLDAELRRVAGDDKLAKAVTEVFEAAVARLGTAKGDIERSSRGHRYDFDVYLTNQALKLTREPASKAPAPLALLGL